MRKQNTAGESRNVLKKLYPGTLAIIVLVSASALTAGQVPSREEAGAAQPPRQCPNAVNNGSRIGGAKVLHRRCAGESKRREDAFL